MPKLGQSSLREEKEDVVWRTSWHAVIAAASRPWWWWPQQILGRVGELGRKSTRRKQLIAEGKDWGERGKSD